MRIYLQPPQPSRGLQRIADALVRYAPPRLVISDNEYERVLITNNAGEADLVILYAIGRRDALEALTAAISKSKFQKYAVIQICLRSTMQPDTAAWHNIWEGAEAVWSYYDLAQAAAEDGYCGNPDCFQETVNFYHAPLGADAETFQVYPNWGNKRDYVVMSSGLSRLSESVRECHLAAKEVGRESAHLGKELNMPFVHCYSSVPDHVLRGLYNMSEFVSGLRRKEGFELPAVEGLLCGARPIVFNTPDYRWAYGNHALYIEETDRQGVIDQLVEIFKHGAPLVTPEERELAVKRYDWAKIVGGFYERLGC